MSSSAWSRKQINIVTSIDRLQSYQVSESTTALDRLPLGQNYEPKDFEVLNEFLESSGDLPEPTREFESNLYPQPDDFGDPAAEGDEPPRPLSPNIPQPRISPRKVRQNWTRARGRSPPDSDFPSEDDEEMGSKNEEDPKDPEYIPPDSLMDSEEESKKEDTRVSKDSEMEPEEGHITPPHRRHEAEGFQEELARTP